MPRSTSTSRPYPPRRDLCRSARRHRARAARHSRPPCEPRSRGLPGLTRQRSSTSPRTLGSAPLLPRVAPTPLERSLGIAPTLLPQSHAIPSLSRPARLCPARSPRRPRRPVPADSSSPSCSSRSRRRASLPGRRGVSRPRGAASVPTAMTAPASERHPVDPGAAARAEASIPVLRPLSLLPTLLAGSRQVLANSPGSRQEPRDSPVVPLLCVRRRKREAAGLGAGIDLSRPSDERASKS